MEGGGMGMLRGGRDGGSVALCRNCGPLNTSARLRGKEEKGKRKKEERRSNRKKKAEEEDNLGST